MFGRNLSEKLFRSCLWATVAIYVCMAVLYFIPSVRIFPLVILAASSIILLPWPMSCAMILSFMGDIAGSVGAFMVQLECFAVAHLFMVLFFVRRAYCIYRHRFDGGAGTSGAVATFCLAAVVVMAVLSTAMMEIIPCVEPGPQKAGTISYAVIISLMLFSSLLQRSVLYALGGVLFVISDMILAWNRFVEPLEYEKYLIMVPYLTAQFLLFIRSARLRVRA